MTRKERIKNHLDWLRDLHNGEDAVLSRAIFNAAVLSWDEIDQESEGRMPLPAACTGPDGQMFYSWDKDEHHLEIELDPGDGNFWFYRNRKTEIMWGDDWAVGSKLPWWLPKKLALFYEDESIHDKVMELAKSPKTKDEARKSLQELGIIDENGELTERYKS